jgi:hypothetical protein
MTDRTEESDKVLDNEIDRVAGTLYEAYCTAVGGVSAFSGHKLPTWEDQLSRESTDEKVATVIKGWRAVASVRKSC